MGPSGPQDLAEYVLILTGTIIVIAGVAFIASGGPGILILAPAAAVLLTSEIETTPPETLKQERL